MGVGYDVECTMGLTLGHGAWQIDRPCNGSMWNSYSFQPVGQWMGYSFTDLGAAGCCRSLNALLTLFPSCYHHEIFSMITNNRSDVYAKVQGQRSKVKVTQVKTQISRFGTITPILFHIWWWNDAQSLILFRSSAPLIFKVNCHISRSHG